LKLSLGFSPCPNDTFIFDALVNGKLPESGIEFEPQLEDVETLNLWAKDSRLDLTKVSVGVMAAISSSYQILDAGSALGFGVGPLLISRTKIAADPETLKALTVAIPGLNTTANLLLSLAFPELKQKKIMLFSEIEDAVLSGKVDAGLIIHENRFTYHAKGLHKIIDLGKYWEEQHQMPIPLGCIAIRRSLPESVKQQVSLLISESIERAFRFPEDTMSYVSVHSQEMEETVMRKHIALYVNEFSVSLGKSGRKAIEMLLYAGKKAGFMPDASTSLFIIPEQ